MKPRNTEKLIASLVDAAMRNHGWLAHELSLQHTLYLMNTPVSPYFVFTGLDARPNDYYFLRGGIGVWHRDFEKTWADRSRQSESSAHTYVFAIDIANFTNSERTWLIGSEGPQDAVDDHCSAINELLNQMPSSEHALQSGIERGTIVGISAQRFFNPVDRVKSEAFREFLASRKGHG